MIVASKCKIEVPKFFLHIGWEVLVVRLMRVAVAMVAAGPVLAQDSAKIEVKQIMSTSINSFGQQISFPQGPGQVSVSNYEIPPKAELPVHKHLMPRIGYILSGILQVTNVDTGEIHTFHKGEVILESVDMWHKGSNPGTEPLKLLVIDLQPKGAGNPTVLKP